MAPLILLVEDYADAREMYRAFLTYAGFRVEMAANGFEAIEKTRALLPDVILMDLSLPAFIEKPCLPEQVLLEVCRYLTASDRDETAAAPGTASGDRRGPERL